MNLRLGAFIAVFALVLPAAAAPAVAQFQPAPQQQQQEPPCVKEFLRLRGDVEKKAAAIRTAGQHKAPPQVACKLFNTFSTAEAKMLKYATDNSVWCGIPPQAITNMKQAHAKTTEMRTKICRIAAAGPPRPAGPSLSDALGGNVPDSSNIKTGHGTFDTLTGTPLGNK
jgi:hypothetical protein